MLKKGISRAKLVSNLYMMIKRGKIAGKSLHKLCPPPHNWSCCHIPRNLPPPPSDDENEFSCTTTPQSQNKHYHLDANDVIVKALQILKSANASPTLSRFGKSPMVKELKRKNEHFVFGLENEWEDFVNPDKIKTKSKGKREGTSRGTLLWKGLNSYTRNGVEEVSGRHKENNNGKSETNNQFVSVKSEAKFVSV
ncbi:hypothetical protein Tco_1015128 [Tanacetum coccineum]|uniref:Uncharacterized protein n=1 Tax=Tanacetum coccineum TaxID=301880 RepID=A0ABQ5FL95_9ASTR